MRTREQRTIDTIFFWISYLWRGRDFIIWERQQSASARMEIYWRNGQKWARLHIQHEGGPVMTPYVCRLIGKDY